MRIIQNDECPKRNTVVTIGSFDGVHRGHQELIRTAREIARTRELDMVVLTFDPHPLAVLRESSTSYLLTPTDLKLDYLRQYQVPWVRVLPFTRELAMVPAFAFLELEIYSALRVQAVVVGYNFTFGAGGAGTPETLRQWGESRGVSVHVVDPVLLADSTVISSSLIRKHIQNGAVHEAMQALGHPFAVLSSVVEGDGRGRQLGFPTVNMKPPNEQLAPPYGVYAGRFGEGSDISRPAVANWGVRPTFGGQEPVLEVHLLDNGPGPSAGHLVRFDFVRHLRAERRFASSKELQSQIGQDVAHARRVLEEEKGLG